MGVIKMSLPKAIVMDLVGTAIKTQFVDKVLMTYVKANVKSFLEEKWDDNRVKRAVDSLRKESAEGESGVKIAAADATKEEQMQSIADYVTHCADLKKESKAMSKLRFLLWFDGYDKGNLQTPIYSDVGIQVKKWKDLGIKLYVLSNTWVEATKKFLSKTSLGDLNLMIDGHYDTSMGQLNATDTYSKLISTIGVAANEVLFLTKAPEQAKAAKEAGLSTCLVLTHRKAIEKLTEEEREYPRVRSLNELDFESPTDTPVE